MSALTVHEFIRELDASRIHYAVTSVRDGAVMVEVTLPGERWEVEFFEGRDIEIEVFVSDGTIHGPEKLAELRDKAKD